METVKIIKNPTAEYLEKNKVYSWPIWEKEPSGFNWSYSQKETCYILEGYAKVELQDAKIVEFGKGDIIIFPGGLNCVWDIKEKIKKHYKLG